MKETTNERIDIASSILETIKNKQYKENINYTKDFINPELRPLYFYYIKENIMALFGRTEFDSDEIEIISTKEGIIIESIFMSPLFIHCVNTQVGPNIVALVENKEVFRIEKQPDMIVNRVMGQNGVLTVYKTNEEENEFTFYQGETSDFYTNEEDLEYIAKLSNINAKFKEFETFEFTRIKPAMEKSKSFFKRIIENVTNDNYIRIPTSLELVRTSIFADSIFDKIKEMKAKDEAKKLKRMQ